MISKEKKIPSVSHPSRGAWIEMWLVSDKALAEPKSHPSRGAWIEIGIGNIIPQLAESRTPRGVRGLKYQRSFREPPDPGRTPRGVRGLK